MSDLPCCTERPPRSPRQLVLARDFGPFFFGKLLSHVGMWVQNVTAAIYVFDLTGSAAAVGLVSVFQFSPQMVLAPWMGAASDRADRRKLLIIGRVISLSASAALAVWVAATPRQEPEHVTPVFAAALVAGIGFAISSPAMNALVPNLVPPKELFHAVALNSSTANVARAIGPAAGAASYVAFGPAPAFAIAALGHAFFIGGLAILEYQPRALSSSDTSIREGFSYLSRNPLIVTLLACVFGVGFTVDAVVTLTPSLAAELGQSESFVGVLASMFGIGAVLALTSATYWQKRVGLATASSIGFAVSAAGFAALAAAPTPLGTFPSMVVAGFGFLITVSVLTSRIQLLVPEELRGRVMAVWSVAFLGSRPVAAFVNGWVADRHSPRSALLLSVLVSIAGGTVMLTRGSASTDSSGQ